MVSGHIEFLSFPHSQDLNREELWQEGRKDLLTYFEESIKGNFQERESLQGGRKYLKLLLKSSSESLISPVFISN